MNWFYASNGQQAGPVTDAELDRLAQSGAIDAATLVWQSGMADWQPYAQARSGVRAPVGAASAALVGAGQAQCSQCGQVFPADEVVRVDNHNVCAACKPLLLQKLSEGVPIQDANARVRYAGFWIRFGAACLDFLILIPFYLLIGLAFYFLTDLHNVVFNGAHPEEIRRATRQFLPLNLVAQFLLACYSAFCINRFGGTPGKRICKLRVVRGAAGGQVSFLRGLGRFAAKTVPRALPNLLLTSLLPPGVVSFLSLVISLGDVIFIVFDGQRRAIHDMICDTRVRDENPR